LGRCPILVRLYPKIGVGGTPSCHEHGWATRISWKTTNSIGESGIGVLGCPYVAL
jgi:hypothetical protein